MTQVSSKEKKNCRQSDFFIFFRKTQKNQERMVQLYFINFKTIQLWFQFNVFDLQIIFASVLKNDKVPQNHICVILSISVIIFDSNSVDECIQIIL